MSALLLTSNILLFIFIVNASPEPEEFVQSPESIYYCKYDIDCAPNSFCFGNDGVNQGKCRCMEKYVLVNRNTTYFECLSVADGLNSTCERDVQCQVNLGKYAGCSETEKVCQCTDGAHAGRDGSCYKIVPLGELCKSNFNCRLSDGSYGFCVVGRCSCNINYHPSEDNQRCIPSVPLGKQCELTESCIHTFANCYGGLCKCIGGYIESSNNTLCLKAADAVGDPCIETTQCSAYISESFCVNDVCSCRSARHGYGNECVPDALLGARCIHHKECILSPELEHSVQCNGGVCTCVKGVSDEHSYGCVVVPGKGIQLQTSIVAFVICSICLLINM